MRRISCLIFGVILIIIGIIECFLPGPGLLLILLGFSLILAKSPKVLIQKILSYLKEKKRHANKILLFLFILTLTGCVSSLKKADLYSEKSTRSYKTAIKEYENALRISKDRGEIHYKLAKLYFNHGDYESAIKELSQVSPILGQKLLAICYFKIQDFTSALSIFSQGDEKITDPEYLYYYGLTCERLNLYEKAEEVYERIKDERYSLLAKERLVKIKPKLEKESEPFIQSLIQESLLKEYPEAGAIILFCDEKIELNPDNTWESEGHLIVKILNERGKKDFSEVEIGYDSTYEKVEIIYAKTIRPDGEVLLVGEKDIRDVSKYLNFPLYSNARAKIISMPEVAIGAIIEYRIKIKREELINKKDFVLSYRIQESEPILKANLEIIIPENREVYTKVINQEYNKSGINLSPKIFKEENKKIYRYEFKDIPQIIPESNSPPHSQINTTILFSTFESWEEIYRWWWDLAKDKMGSDENIKKKVKEITKDKTSLEEKIRAIYNFVAEDIRYVAIEYGQAGYTPHKAQDIFMNKYGDCKDKTILLVAMLKEIGVEAYPVLIGTEDYYNLEEDFPAIFFNHCITAIKIDKKIQFVDPTCEVCSFEDLPSDDQERKVLLFKEDSFEILPIPLSSSERNLIEYEMKIEVDRNEEVSAERKITAQGEFDQAQRFYVKYTPPKLLEEDLRKKISEFCIEGKLISYEIQNLESLDKNIILRYNFRGKDYFIKAGDLRILPIYAEINTSIVSQDEREYPLDLGIPDQIKNTIELEIPKDFKVRYILPSIEERSEWMDFNIEYRIEENKIYFKQTQSVKKRRVPKEDYIRFKEFIEKLASLVNERIVLEYEK